MIISGPEHQIVAPDDKILFNCIAQGEFVFWQIDKQCPCNETDKAKFEERGFHFSQDGEHNKIISVEATLAWSTRLTSRASDYCRCVQMAKNAMIK